MSKPIPVMSPRQGYCQATVWVREKYRRSGRARSGFKMHYTERQCRHKVKGGERYCFQHREISKGTA